MQAAGYIKHTAEPWERVYLRGQGELYDTLSPTLYRGIAGAQAKRHGQLESLIQEFSTASSLFAGVLDYAKEPLLQHYGIQTTWLDVVDNIWVALWFAINKVSVAGDEKQYIHFDSREQPHDGSYCYILLIKTQEDRREKAKKGYYKSQTSEVVDLRVAAPSVFLRPHAQHGLLFRSKGQVGGRQLDYSGAIAGVIRFTLGAGKLWLGEGAMHNVRGLFPPPYFDSGYSILLGVEHTERRIGNIVHIGA